MRARSKYFVLISVEDVQTHYPQVKRVLAGKTRKWILSKVPCNKSRLDARSLKSII